MGSADQRWQGYSHEQLYQMLHSGPGGSAAGPVADRWAAMSDALSDIQQGINAGVTGSGATWVGSAGDTARGQLGPLGEWAQQAASGAEVMRISTELQADLLGKARAAMPVPAPTPVPPSPMARLVGAQVDYEAAELDQQVAQEVAYQVMAQYEAATSDNTSTLGDFGQPPALAIDTSPITGVTGRAPVEDPDQVGSTSPVRPAGGTATSPDESRAPQRESRPSNRSHESSSVEPADTEPADRPTTTSGTPAPAQPETQPTTPSSTAPDPTVPSSTTPSSTRPSLTGPNSAAPGPAAPDRGVTSPGGSASRGGSTGLSAADPVPSTHDRRTSTDSPDAGVGAQGGRFTGGAMVPTARRPQGEDEPDDLVHESKYLIEADDIYGRQTYSPPVIGETPRRR